jgi:hypothetical protein
MSTPAVAWPRPWQLCRWWRLLRRNDAVGREAWGYVFWIPLIVLLFLPAELVPAFGGPDWPTFSTTIGHLEYLFAPTALLVVALMVFTAFNALARRHGETGLSAKGHYRLDHTGGRIIWKHAKQPPAGKDSISRWQLLYLPVGAVLIAGLSTIAFVWGGYWPGAYVLWSLVAFAVIVLPSILSFFFARSVPFPTLFRTVQNLRDHVHMIATAVLAFLVVLAVHLSLYPWPNVAHVVQVDHQIAPTVSGSAVQGSTVTVSGTVENCARPKKVLVVSPVFAASTASVHNGHYKLNVKLTKTPTKEDTVRVFCGRPEVGSAHFK